MIITVALIAVGYILIACYFGWHFWPRPTAEMSRILAVVFAAIWPLTLILGIAGFIVMCIQMVKHG